MTTGSGDTRPGDAVPPADPELDALMERLRAVAAVDDPPPLVDALARAAFETRDLDAELAVLTADSAVDELALVRSTPTASPRMLSFETETVGVELQIDRTVDGVALRGLLSGTDPTRAEVTLEAETADGRTRLDVDPHGWFQATALPDGPLRLRLTYRAGGVTTTPWISTRGT